MSKSNAIELALMAKASPSIIICEENISSSSWVFNVTDIFFNAPLAQISDEWLVIGEFSIAKVTDGVSAAKDKGKAIKIAEW